MKTAAIHSKSPAQNQDSITPAKKSGNLNDRSVIETSPNNRHFGSAPEVMALIGRIILAAIPTIIGTAISISYAVGYYTAGGTLGIAVAIGIGGTLASIVAGYLFFNSISK